MAAKVCTRCGAPLPPEATYCPRCGVIVNVAGDQTVEPETTPAKKQPRGGLVAAIAGAVAAVTALVLLTVFLFVPAMTRPNLAPAETSVTKLSGSTIASEPDDDTPTAADASTSEPEPEAETGTETETNTAATETAPTTPETTTGESLVFTGQKDRFAVTIPAGFVQVSSESLFEGGEETVFQNADNSMTVTVGVYADGRGTDGMPEGMTELEYYYNEALAQHNPSYHVIAPDQEYFAYSYTDGGTVHYLKEYDSGDFYRLAIEYPAANESACRDLTNTIAESFILTK